MSEEQVSSPQNRAYDPVRRPNVYYKGDPASDAAMMENALQARKNEVSADFGSRGNSAATETRQNAEEVLGLGRWPETDMTVEEAQQRAKEGRPVHGDASIERFRPEGLNDVLDEVNYHRDNAADAADELESAEEKLSSAQDVRDSAAHEAHKTKRAHEDAKSDAANFVKQKRGK